MDEKDRKIKKLEEAVDTLQTQNITLGTRINQFYKLTAYTTLGQCKDDDTVSQLIKDKLLKVVLGKAMVADWKIIEGQPIEPLLMGE